ncbi:MAG: 1-deoxy-D-xylulose-5-phosphate synthase [Oligoflexia bacterium]|nr:1-deoxy-D-xylulose-5-phosphate synthase [Oligoflexia bacterium]
MAIQSPEELRALSINELQDLAADIRQQIISACLSNGGHLGSSLGAVELAIALHYVFQSPREPIVWDVGHQAYAHKLITGRWPRFGTLRLEDGLSGFLRRDESPHDAFGVGHSSTALSAALAMAWNRGRTDRDAWTVAVVGDGGLTSGIALEALNRVRETPLAPLLLVLNDNQMSISPNSGALSTILAQGEAGKFFELFGFDYLGPIDGHDLSALIGTLRGVKEDWAGKPVLLHVVTEKGKGYAPAEKQPASFHGISGIRPAGTAAASFSQTFGEALCELAEQDPRVVAVTAAMTEGTGLTAFARKFPDRFFDVGIAEGHAVTFAAGLATQGYKPVVAIYSTFLQRAYDSVIHDVALQDLGVVFAIDRAGAVGPDGPTHHGAFDLSFLGPVPNLRVSSPSCLEDLKGCLQRALSSGKPWAIRYPRGGGASTLPGAVEDGVRWLRNPARPELLVLGAGPAVVQLLEAAGRLDPNSEKIAVIGVLDLKPIPASVIEFFKTHPSIPWLAAEPGSRRGGFGESLLAASATAGATGRFQLAGYGDHFMGHGTQDGLEALEGLSVSALAEKMRGLLG